MPSDALPPVDPANKPPALPLFALLETPYGIQFALCTAVPMVILRNAGVPIAQAGAIAALATLPSTFYFAYSPLVDFFVRRRTWLLIAVTLTALVTPTTILIAPANHLTLISALLFTGTIAAMLISAATGGLMGSLLDPPRKARVGAWVQLGNCGANSLFFGLMLYLTGHVSRPTLAIVSALCILLPGLAVLAIREPALTPSSTTYLATVRGIGVELRRTFLSLRSIPGILLLVSPIGTGAITSVLSGMVRDYHASDAQLAFANGWGGGLLTAIGALCILLMPARWNRLVPYALAGIFYGGVSLAIAAGPLRPSTLIVGLLVSNFAQGVVFAAYTGVILQTMGLGGRCHSSRYTILNSIGNVPVVYMTAFLSQVAGRFGVRAVGLVDGSANLTVAAIFFAWYAWVRLRHHHFLDSPAPLPAEV